MDRFEVIPSVRKQIKYKDIPIIIVTGLSSREDRIRAVAIGANDFIFPGFFMEN
ncbi:MAG: hypothetical protein HN978_18555 [Desulfobacula sp.]|jgi:putative two-component system response regulator|nr:hypothetical protein [Desulfobacula sp.]MBT7051652.1 hypothetical protein [Desulfobacula sp.]